MSTELSVRTPNGDWPETLRRIRLRTPARLLMGRVGSSYDTATQLRLRQDHAAARDAVHAEFDLQILGQEAGAFLVGTRASSKAEYLMRPDLGRRLDAAAPETIRAKCALGCDLQVAIGDGLSVTAVAAQVPELLPLLRQGAEQRGWTYGQPFALRYCRVGLMNEIGDLLRPKVLVLLIGERPGMTTAESLSAYMAYRPRPGHTDADRDLVSNIHARGTPVAEACGRILGLAEGMMRRRASGIRLVDLPECKPALRP